MLEILSVFDEDYSRNMPCSLKLISTFLLLYWGWYSWWWTL